MLGRCSQGRTEGFPGPVFYLQAMFCGGLRWSPITNSNVSKATYFETQSDHKHGRTDTSYSIFWCLPQHAQYKCCFLFLLFLTLSFRLSTHGYTNCLIYHTHIPLLNLPGETLASPSLLRFLLLNHIFPDLWQMF